MPTSLTLLTNGTTVSASALQTYAADIETYVNEEIAAADLEPTSWVNPYHIFKPEFRGSPDPAANLVTGMTHYRMGDAGVYGRSVHHHHLVGGTADTAYVPVMDMQATIKIPGTSARNVKVLASFYAYEFGGQGTTDEATNLCARFAIKTDDTLRGTTFRDLYTASDATAAGDSGRIHCRKQHTIAGYFSLAAGIHQVGVWVRVYTVTTAAAPEWRHIFVSHRNLVVDYYTA